MQAVVPPSSWGLRPFEAGVRVLGHATVSDLVITTDSQWTNHKLDIWTIKREETQEIQRVLLVLQAHSGLEADRRE